MSAKSVILAVAVAVLSVSTALAQGWHEYISRDEFFLVGMPSAPQITSTTYRAASGAMLPAKQFVATEGQRRYTVTVVHYMNSSVADEAAAIEHAVRSFRNRPAQVTYDREQLIEGLPAHMIYLLNPDQSRIAAGVILHPRDTGHGGPGRLYILEGHVPAGAAPAIQFPQSFLLMDENANRLDYVTNAAGQRVRNVRTQQAGVSGPYGAREPATCTAADQAQGKPTAAQVAQYIKCTLEGIGDGALFLIENIQVREIGDAGQFDASFFPDIDTRQPVYPIRGSLLLYNCDREGRNVAWGRAEPGLDRYAPIPVQGLRGRRLSRWKSERSVPLGPQGGCVGEDAEVPADCRCLFVHSDTVPALGQRVSPRALQPHHGSVPFSSL